MQATGILAPPPLCTPHLSNIGSSPLHVRDRIRTTFGLFDATEFIQKFQSYSLKKAIWWSIQLAGVQIVHYQRG